MKTLLVTFLALVTAVWGWDLAVTSSPPGVVTPWLLRQQALTLSGLLSIALMSLAMMLATRPAWLERPLGGMDRIYRLHKWAGILAVGLAATHWLIEMSDDILKAVVGRAGRVPEDRYAGFLEVLRKLGEDMGEWAIYACLLYTSIAPSVTSSAGTRSSPSHNERERSRPGAAGAPAAATRSICQYRPE